MFTKIFALEEHPRFLGGKPVGVPDVQAAPRRMVAKDMRKAAACHRH
jgi:hypothetical protein